MSSAYQKGLINKLFFWFWKNRILDNYEYREMKLIPKITALGLRSCYIDHSFQRVRTKFMIKIGKWYI